MFSFVTPVAAQPPAAPSLTTLLARPEQFEGTVSVTSGGTTVRGKLQFQAPDSLRAEVIGGENTFVQPQTYVSQGSSTQSFSTATGRVRSWRYSALTQPWRSNALVDGGPAGIALFGWPQNASTFYTVAPSKSSPKNAANSFTLTAKKDVGHNLVYESVFVKGSNKGAFYAVRKRPQFDRPAQMILNFSADGKLLSREDRDENNRVLTKTDFVWNVTTKLPQSATVKDRTGKLLETWSYNLQSGATTFPAETFSLPAAAKDQIAEDANLKPIADYEKDSSADAKYNLGVALLRHVEDISGAMRAWGEAARLKPQAIAPHAAIFDTALRTRDLNIAQQALAKLTSLRGADDVSVFTRRATLESRNRNWKAAADALRTAIGQQPQNTDLRLNLANIARWTGDFATARVQVLEVLKSDSASPAAQSDAAEMLAALASTTSEATDSLAALPRNTEAQKLARSLIEIAQSQTPETSFKSLNAQASVAQALERAGSTEAAIAAWQKLASATPIVADSLNSPIVYNASIRESTILALGAREHLVALHAARGEAGPSLTRARELLSSARDESDKNRWIYFVIDAWQKSLHTDLLRTTLQGRTLSTSATEDDLRLWLAWQETYGTDQDIEKAIRTGAVKYPKSAWWQSRLGEYLWNSAQDFRLQDTAKRTLTNQAIAAINKAAQLEPEQTLYPMQAALVLTQFSKRRQVILDAGQSVEDEKRATTALDSLVKKWPADPDVALAVALGRNSLATLADAAAITAIDDALRRGTPEPDTLDRDRHVALSFARQAQIVLLRHAKRAPEVARQYESLLLSSRDTSEQLAIATQYLGFLLENESTAPQTVAGLLRRVANEAWSFEAAQGELAAISRALAARDINPNATTKTVTPAISRALLATTDAPSVLAAAQLHFALEESSRALANQDGAPASATRLARETATLAAASESALKTLTNDSNKRFAARAAALLAQRSLAAKNDAETTTWLQKALEGEPASSELRVAQARALSGDSAKIATLRDDFLRALPRSADNLRRAAVLSRMAKQNDQAAKLISQSLMQAQISRTSLDQTADIALLAARYLFTAGQEARAQEIWTGFATLLPQASTQKDALPVGYWSYNIRLAAIVDQEKQLRLAGRAADADRIAALGNQMQPTQADINSAQAYLASLE